MLPSRGFFKKNDCPFFEKGLCVRPHCHFRHKKKVICENSSSVDSRDSLILSQNLADVPLVNSIGDESSSVSDSSSTSNRTQYSSDNTNYKEGESNHDSLFAKLVNQSNPYEKISRHIPCAYTPTPQVKGVQPKNKSVSVKYSENNISNVSNKSQTVFGYKSVNCKETENVVVPNLSQDCLGSATLNGTTNVQSSTSSSNHQKNKFTSDNSECKIPFFDSGAPESYEPQSTIKSKSNELSKNTAYVNCSDYVPSKVTSGESQYVPHSNDTSLPCSYVPSKEKQKETQYVPEPTGSIKNPVVYKPSDKTSAEAQYQPEGSSCVAKYVPTEKSATKACTSWSEDDIKNELSEIEFISSEIELMKELLKDEAYEKEPKIGEKSLKTEYSENKSKNVDSHRDKHKSSKSHHSSRSSSRSGSSRHGHSSSSKSKSSSHSSKSSRSDRHRSSSKSRSKSSSSHRKSKHHSSSRESHRSKSNKDKKSDCQEPKDKRTVENKKTDERSSESEDDDTVDGFVSDQGDNSGKGESSETESENLIKKRKNTWATEDRQSKFFKKSVDELFEDLEDDPDTVEKECLEIFNSYTSTVEANTLKKPKEVSLPPEEYESTTQGKKRTAHSTVITSDHSVLRHKTSKTVRNSIKSAQEVMLERYKTIEKAKENQTAQQPHPQPAPILGLARPSVKIAAVSNIQQMLQAKKAIQDKINKGMKVNERTTIAQTVTPGSSRVAHTPAAGKEMTEKPTVSGGSKQVPRIKRQIYLEKLMLETNQIYPTKGESAEEALKLEEEVFRANSGSSSAYHAAFVSMLLKTRRRVAALKGETSKINVPRTKMSHYDVLSGGKKNFSVLKTKKVDISMLTERHIYEELLRCKLTSEELKENGYPMESDRPGYATCSLNFELKYNNKYLHIKKLKGNRRYCIRCSKQYEVDPITLKQYKEGPETCYYHPGKKKSGGRNSDRIYNCCNSASSEGCTTHVRHVTDCNDYERLPNCVKTLSKENETNPGIFALDCEMVYTRLGYELARVTVVNLKKEIVYDTLVKPKYPIECYNTFFSGIEEKMMEGVETTLKDVQAVLLSMFSEKTILIGHSLDSDLRALHLIHDTVVDTAIVYKNEKYHPYKYSLKDLCAKKISKIIQDNVNGHDSAEDAVAALEIMLNHVKEEVSKYDSLESYEADRFK